MTEVEFGSLFEFIRNGMNIKQDKSGDGLPITRIETIADGTVNPVRVGYAGLGEQASATWLLQCGDILFSHINSVEHVGKCAIYKGFPDKLIHGMNLLCLRCNKEKIFPEFARYLIRGSIFRGRLAAYINKAVNQASVSIGNLRTIPVQVPPLEAQRRIAAILDQADALRAKRREAMEQLDELAQAIFVEMFGDQAEADGTWEQVELGNVVEMVTGYPFRSDEYVENGDRIRLCRGTNVLPGRIDWSDLASWPMSKSNDFKNFKLDEGDIVLAMDRPWISEGFKLAKIRAEDCPAFLVQRVARIRSGRAVTNEFILMLLGQSKFARHCRPTETTVPHISPKEIRSFRFSLPPLALQQTFATRIQAVEVLKTTHRAALAEFDALFASLQQRAFTGAL